MAARGKGKTAAIRQWELETIAYLGWRESAWVRLPIEERYRKVVAFKLPTWMAALESEEEYRRIKAKSNG